MPETVRLVVLAVPKKPAPETESAVEDAYVMTPFVENRLVAVRAVEEAYGNVLAMVVEVAMK